MEDIKKLYQEAKAYGTIHTKSNPALRNYMEAVDRIASNCPKEYISNLEYIISSSYGANTFSSFLEKHKVPLSYIPKIKNAIKTLKNKNEDNKLSDTYSDMINVMESYENKYSNCMDMAIYFEDCLDDRYLEAYYTNFPKLSNKNVNISKFLERYGNGCIADMIVYTEADKALLENVYDQMVDKKKKLSNNQWIKDSLKDFSYVDNEILDVFTKESLEYQVNQSLENNEQAFRESVMMGMQMVSPFTESDVQNMEDYILYQEYKLCGAKNESERTLIMESINRTKKALEPLMIEEDVADSVIPMLPGARVSKPILSKQFTEALSMENPKIYYNQNNLPKPLDSVVNNIIEDLATTMKDLMLTDPRFSSIKESHSFKNIESELDRVIKFCYDITYDVSCNSQSAPGIDIFNILDLYEYTDGPMEFDNPRDQLYDDRAYYLGTYGFRNEAASMLLAKTIFELLSEKYNELLQNYGMILMNQEMINNSNYIDTKCFVSGEYNLEIFIAICPSSENFARKLYDGIVSNMITSPSSNNSFTEATKYPEQKRSRFNKKPRSGSEVIQYIEDVDNDKFKEWFFKTPAGSKLNKKTFDFKSLVDDEQNIDSVGYVFKNEIVAIATINNARSKTNKVNICAVHPRHKGCLVNLFRLIDSRWISDTTVELNKSTQKEFVDAFQSIGYEITLERGQVVTLSRKKKTKGTAKTKSVSFTEALSSNTRNKKTGKAPGYLRNNHDLSYGEDDDTDDSDDVGDDIFGDHIDDTSKEKKTSKTEPEPYQYDDIDDDSPDNAEKDKPASGANYYYYNYNYTNSNNTSSKSHNDYSTHTSHDSHDKKYHTINNTNSNNVTKTVDSHNQKNDNSTNKRVHSHDYGDHHEESVKIYSEQGNIRPDWWGSTFYPVYLPEDLRDSLRRMRMEFFETIINIVQTNQKFAPLINDEYFKLLRFFGNYRPDEYEDDNGMIFFGNPGGYIGCGLFIISNNFLRYDYWENIYRIHQNLDKNPNFDLDQALRDLHSAARNAMAEKYNGTEPVTGCAIDTRDSVNDLFTAESTDPKHVAHLWNTIGKYASIKSGDTMFIGLNEDGTEFIVDEPIQESVYQEEVGDADDDKPESDNPIRDTMMDIDRKVSEGIGSLKRGAGKVRQTARAVTKPFKRVLNFIDTQIEKWRDSNENDIKEQLADPHQSNSLIKAFKSAVKYGAIYKAGLLLNPIFIFLAAAKHLDSRNNKFRIRNEMIGELKTELQVLEEKIKDADANKDRKAKYQMMRLKNELTKKLIRVGGTGDMKNMI